MKISAVAVSTTDMQKTVEFYMLLGFKFPKFHTDEKHVEPVTPDGSVRLMIDSRDLMTELLGHLPKPGNHSNFCN